LAQAGGAPLKSSMAERTGLTRLNVALLAFGFGPLLAEFFANLWGRRYYQFFPLALAGAGFLAWSRLNEVPGPLESGHAAVAAPLMGASFCLLAAGMTLWSPWLASLAAVLLGVLTHLFEQVDRRSEEARKAARLKSRSEKH